MIQIGLDLPLLFGLPVALTAIILAVRFSLDPLRRFRSRLYRRTGPSLSGDPVCILDLELALHSEDPSTWIAQVFDPERLTFTNCRRCDADTLYASAGGHNY